MSLSKLFNRIFWHNNTTPDINEDNLNAMSKGLSDVDDRLISLAGTIMEDVPQIQEDIADLQEAEATFNAAIQSAQDAATNAQNSANEAAGSVTSAQQKALIAEGWAKGTQNGSPVSQSSPYWENNAEYWAGKARSFTPEGYQDLVDEVEDVKQTLSNLTDTVSDSEAYVLRQGKGNMVDMELVGGSVAWNQRIYNGNFASTSGWVSSSSTFSVSNNKGILKATARYGRVSQELTSLADHKYLLFATLKSYKNTGTVWKIRKFKSSDYTVTEDINVTLSTTENTYAKVETGMYKIGIFVQDDNTGDWGNIELSNFMCIDLTALFGSTIADYIYSLEQATAGAGVAWFRKYFPNAYYGYQRGKIESVNVANRKVVGKNLYTDSPSFDGFIDANIWTLQSETLNGHPVYKSNTAWRGMWKSIYLPVGTYTFSVQAKMDTSAQCYLYVLQGLLQNPAELDVTTIYITPTTSWSKYSGTFTVTKAGTVAFRIECYANNMGLYISEYQLEIGSTATDYEPYKEYTFPFANKQLRGIPKLVDNKLSYDGDIYTADGTVTRKYGIVDLGTRTWTYDSSNRRFVSDQFSSIKQTSDARVLQLLCPKYVCLHNVELFDSDWNNVVYNTAEESICIHDHSYTDPATFKTDMSGVYLVFPKQTPTTESAEPYQNPQRAFIEGTEEFVDYGVQSATRDVSIPVGNNTTYQLNETLPPIEDYVDGAVKILLKDKILAKDVPSSSDFNSYTEEGNYCFDATTASTLANCPVSTACNLRILNAGGGVVQILTTYSAEPLVYIRTNYGSAWNSWYKFQGTVVA